MRSTALAELLITFAVLLLAVSSTIAQKKSEDWGYVKVRPNASMFWWLYYTQGTIQQVPLVMWLQGGPGASSTGFGNFAELGPLDEDLKPRNSTWVKQAHVLFVDNPVGSGFSYVTSDDAYTTNVKQIAADLLTLLKDFMKKLPDFQKVPFYIFCESYGGKMTTEFAWTLYQAIEAKEINCNFKGIALGDSWISPIDSVLTWGPYLYVTSLVDETGLSTIMDIATKCQQAVIHGNWSLATNLWSAAESIVEEVTDNVNFYNILNKTPVEKNSRLKFFKHPNAALVKLYQRHVGYMYNDKLSDLMNGPVRKKLQIIPDNVTWGGQSGNVFTYQIEDFMKPVVSTVEKLLDTYVNITVYNGQLDLIVDTVGQEIWIKKLNWTGLPYYAKAERIPLYVQEPDTAAFVKRFKNFGFYWILKAGHMVPADAPEMAQQMVVQVTQR